MPGQHSHPTLTLVGQTGNTYFGGSNGQHLLWWVKRARPTLVGQTGNTYSSWHLAVPLGSMTQYLNAAGMLDYNYLLMLCLIAARVSQYKVAAEYLTAKELSETL